MSWTRSLTAAVRAAPSHGRIHPEAQRSGGIELLLDNMTKQRFSRTGD